MASVTFDNGIVTIQGDATNETFAFRGNSDQTGFSVQVNDDPASNQTFNNADVDRVVLLAGGGDDVVSINTLRVPTEIHGQGGDDTLRGGNADDIINGGGGNDTIYGFAGNDQLLGAAGDDVIFGAGGDDDIKGGLGNDELWGQGDNDTLDGQGGDDFISGGVGNDTLTGGVGADDLRGNSGDDSLTGTADNDADVYRGGTGFDTFNVQGEIGNGSVDQVIDRFGMETFTGYSGPLEPSIELDGDTISVVGSDNRDVYTLDGFNNSANFHIIKSGSGVIGTFSTSDVSEAVFRLGGGNDTLYTDGQTIVPLRVDGGDGDDFIEGGNGRDQLFGGAGDDDIHARGGDDIVVGGDGHDLLHGNTGNDQLFGGVGADRLHGDGGDDILVAGQDDDVDDVDGHGGFNQYFLDVGEDTEDANNSEPVSPVSDAPAEPVFGSSGSGSVDEPDDGDPMTASIGDLVFEDLDEDGIFDAGEVGLEGIVLRLLQDNNELATTTTDSNGNYLFDALSAGDYTIEIDAASLDALDTTTGSTANVTLVEGEANTDADFGAISESGGDTFPATPLGGLLSIFGTGLTDSVSTLAFDAATTPFGIVEDIGLGISVLTIGNRKFAFQSTGGGLIGVGQTSLVGSFPADFPSDFASEVSLVAIAGEATVHVESSNEFGSGQIQLLTPAASGQGGFDIDTIGTATLAVDFSVPGGAIDFSRVSSIIRAATRIDGSRSLSDVFQLVADGKAASAVTLTPAQIATRSQEAEAFLQTITPVLVASGLQSLRDANGDIFVIDDDRTRPGVDRNGNACTIGGGFDCEDYADVGRNFLRNSGVLPASASTNIYAAKYTTSVDADGRTLTTGGHAVVMITFTPSVGETLYYAWDPINGAFTAGNSIAIALQRNVVRSGLTTIALSTPALSEDGELINRGLTPLFMSSSDPVANDNVRSWLLLPDVLAEFRAAVIRAGLGHQIDQYFP